MAEPKFSEVIDWLSDREGKTLYIELGMRDPTMEGNDFFPLAIHATLGKPQIGEDAGRERPMVYIPLTGCDTDRNRVYIDRERITETQIDGLMLRLFFHDSFYIAFSGG